MPTPPPDFTASSSPTQTPWQTRLPPPPKGDDYVRDVLLRSTASDPKAYHLRHSVLFVFDADSADCAKEATWLLATADALFF
jgi:hypothetical protein